MLLRGLPVTMLSVVKTEPKIQQTVVEIIKTLYNCT